MCKQVSARTPAGHPGMKINQKRLLKSNDTQTWLQPQSGNHILGYLACDKNMGSHFSDIIIQIWIFIFRRKSISACEQKRGCAGSGAPGVSSTWPGLAQVSPVPAGRDRWSLWPFLCRNYLPHETSQTAVCAAGVLKLICANSSHSFTLMCTTVPRACFAAIKQIKFLRDLYV